MRNLFWPLQIGGWLAFGVAMALSRVGRYPIDYMIATKLALTAIGFVLSLGLRQLYRRLLRRDPSIVQAHRFELVNGNGLRAEIELPLRR